VAKPAEPPPYAGGTPSTLPGTAIAVALVLGALYAVVAVLDMFTTVRLPGGMRGDPSTLLFGVVLLLGAMLARARYREGFYLAAIVAGLSLVEMVVVHALVGSPATSLVGAIVRGALTAMFFRAGGVMPRPRALSRARLAALALLGLLPSSWSYAQLVRLDRADRVARAGIAALHAGDAAGARSELERALDLAPEHEGARLGLAALVYRDCLAAPPGPANAGCARTVQLLEDGEARAPGLLAENPNAAQLLGEAKARLGAAPAPAAPPAPPAPGK